MTKLIKNVQMINDSGILTATEILIENGKIAAIGEHIENTVDEVIDGKGHVVAPGFVDVHVHLREPGFEHKETIATGS
mgnify:CR=1 FL=1